MLTAPGACALTGTGGPGDVLSESCIIDRWRTDYYGECWSRSKRSECGKEKGVMELKVHDRW